MPILEGTTPQAREWVQCELGEYRAALQSMKRKLPLLEVSVGNQTAHQHEGKVLARHYSHKKSEQCMIHFSMRGHIPERRVINVTEGSIYDA